MAGGGILHRITPEHYHLWDEENLVGSIHAFPQGAEQFGEVHQGWFGQHKGGGITATHPSKHNAARDLMRLHHETKGQGYPEATNKFGEAL